MMRCLIFFIVTNIVYIETEDIPRGLPAINRVAHVRHIGKDNVTESKIESENFLKILLECFITSLHAYTDSYLLPANKRVLHHTFRKVRYLRRGKETQKPKPHVWSPASSVEIQVLTGCDRVVSLNTTQHTKMFFLSKLFFETFPLLSLTCTRLHHSWVMPHRQPFVKQEE